MASEPITIFSGTVAPAEILAAVRDQYPDAEVTGDGADWRAVTLTFGDRADTKVLTLLHDRDYYAGPGWPDQLGGLQAYFGRSAAGDRTPRLMALIRSFRFALGTQFDPAYTAPAADDRFAVILGLTRTLGGVLFSPSGLRDGAGRLLAGPDGAFDADAEWPAGGAGEAAPGPAGGAAPTPDRVARRAVALMAVTARAVIEREVKLGRLPGPQAAEMHARLLGWVGEVGIDDEFEPAERAVLIARPGGLTDRQFFDAMWRVEGLEVLGWALGLSTPPRYDRLSNMDDVWNALGFLDPARVAAVLAAPALRPREELEAYRGQMLGYHWRLRQFRNVAPGPMDFRAFAAGSWFGAFDVSGFDLVDDDLALRGERIDRAAEDAVADAASIAHERHLAANWLCDGPAEYSKTDVAT